ncbi:nuclear transport factor 2 family protein [Thiobacter aerophilum]|uniref:Nuclear transport factor 2 family protein n=1 Tax=Thiobacter aerophilum TaxID=3121275 RepID=A0ABV0EDE3_9BURK
MHKTLLLFAVFAAFSLPAHAGPAEEAARAHFDAIGAGQVDLIMAQYAPQAAFQWVGGPLDGAYGGAEAIREVWSRFAKNAPYTVTVARLEESANDKGATVTANVQFQGKSTVKVRYVLVYRDGKLVNEVWQVDPKLAVSAY